MLESKTLKDGEDRRAQVYGITTDQGKESGIADTDDWKPCFRAESLRNFSRGHGKMYKHALYMPEHLHGVEKLPNHAHYIIRLRGIE
eukprot:25694-Pyramimonas_sp.AAC.1